jgi:putative hydrolase of the HAD superfamily
MQTDATDLEIRGRWNRCPHSRAFGLGRISREEFGKRFVRDWELSLQPEEFLREFRSWSRSFLPGAQELLKSVRVRFRVAALSNSNELHWERNLEELSIGAHFELAISSHQVGLLKPDHEIYRVALHRLNVRPQSVAFLTICMRMWRRRPALGMRAFLVGGVEDVRERLAREGMI